MHIAVKFQPNATSTYTYTYDGTEQIEPGDFVVVDTRDGRKAVEVAAVDVEEPAFRCKPISAILIEKEA